MSLAPDPTPKKLENFVYSPLPNNLVTNLMFHLGELLLCGSAQMIELALFTCSVLFGFGLGNTTLIDLFCFVRTEQ